MTREQIKEKFPNASEAFIRANLSAPDPGPITKLERDPGHGSLATCQVQKAHPGRVLVRVESVRKRLLDEDNCAGKFHVDALRYLGVIQNDDPSKAKIETTQRKAEKGEEEHINITVWPILE